MNALERLYAWLKGRLFGAEHELAKLSAPLDRERWPWIAAVVAGDLAQDSPKAARLVREMPWCQPARPMKSWVQDASGRPINIELGQALVISCVLEAQTLATERGQRVLERLYRLLVASQPSAPRAVVN